MKGRFIVNPFQELNLSAADRAELQKLATQCLTTNFHFCARYIANKRQVDPRRWKMLKKGEKLKVYSERTRVSTTGAADRDEPTGSGLPMLLCVGTMEGKLDDLMFGVISENLETMRVKASYVDDLSGAAVLDDVVHPTHEQPFHSLVIKWMELDIPLRSTHLVKNRDYVYLEGTGYLTNEASERVGYHLLHSVSFAETPELPNRVRANMSLSAFWRQSGPNTLEVYSVAVMDPVDTGLVRKLVLSNMVTVLLSTLKYAYCGQMRKLTYMLDRKYADRKVHGAPNMTRTCVTCSTSVSSRRRGDFGKSKSTCRLCFGFVCAACQIPQKLSFVDPDLLLSQRKVTFCSACISQVTSMCAMDVARAQIAMRTRELSECDSFLMTLSKDSSGGRASISSSTVYDNNNTF